jgi:hypothetical protein
LLLIGGVRLEKAFFLKAADSLGTNLQFDLFTVNNYSFGLQIRLPHFFSMALRKAYVIAVLLAFTCNITYLHIVVPKVSKLNYTGFNL